MLEGGHFRGGFRGGFRGDFHSAFVTQMARMNKGRVFYTSADRLGEYLLVDYISNKRKTI
jgi:uncharacterized protein with von Willebrand factor type A (vWA) domain